MLAPGDTVVIHEAGGGGFGDPRERSRAALLADVESGLVSREGALRDYGVTLDPLVPAATRRGGGVSD